MSPDGRMLEVNQRCWDVFGVGPEAIVGRHIRDFTPREQEQLNLDRYRKTVRQGSALVPMALTHADGSTRYFDFSMNLIEVGGEKLVLAVGRDVTDTVRSTEALVAAEQRYRALVERIPDVVWTTSGRGEVEILSPQVIDICGYTAEEINADGSERWLSRIHPEDQERMRASLVALNTTGKPLDAEFRWLHKNGTWIWLWSRFIATHVRDGGLEYESIFSDITEKKRLEDQLRMSQKMEAIGQLTGGIAHDFNNILAVILANAAFLKEELGPHDKRREDVDDIQHAANRAVAMTRQLLAFSRKQVLEPTIMSMSTVVSGVEKMLRRLIGEDIDLSVAPATDLGTVRADVGQIEQVIMNLVVNARDAMPHGGRLSITTANVDLDEAYAATHVPTVPGRYVMLTVSDTGCGMDAATQRRIFEPFYTTKEKGEGTGLGLATCYGIVKQSGGYIWVHSEPGVGTVFKIYLPRTDCAATVVSSKSSVPHNLRGSETVLLIEDDTAVRAVVARILESYGYRVLIASDGVEAFVVAKLHVEPIHLIVSDMVMPGLSGPEAVGRISKTLVAAKCLFMSGYTDHALLRNGAIPETMSFIQKPFSPEALATKVRTVLDG